MIAPDLSSHPQIVLKQLHKIIGELDQDEFILVGTSLGGWYANEMANEFGIHELLINPLYLSF